MNGRVAKSIRNSVMYYAPLDKDGKPIKERRRYERNHRGDMIAVGIRGAIRNAKKSYKRRRRAL